MTKKEKIKADMISAMKTKEKNEKRCFILFIR